MGALPIVEYGTLYVSVSQLKTFLMCPRRFELRYIRGAEPAFIPAPLAFGTAIHSALARFYFGHQAGTGAPPLELLIQTFRDAWTAAIEGDVPLQVDGEEDIAKLVDLGVRMLDVFHTHAADKVVAVDPVTGEVLEEMLVGVFDLVVREGERRTIVEHKTSAKKYGLDQLDYDLQMSGYKFASNELGWLDTALRFQVITKTKAPAVQEADIVRGPLAQNDFLRTAVGVLRAIDAGVSYPVRGWQCRSCAFAAPCQSLGGGS
jgi:hypothetical protein